MTTFAYGLLRQLTELAVPPLNTIPTTVSPVSGCGSTPAFTTDEAIVPLSRSVDTTTSPWSPAISRRKSSISATALFNPSGFNPGGRVARSLCCYHLRAAAVPSLAAEQAGPARAALGHRRCGPAPPDRGATWARKYPGGHPARASLVARAQGRSSRRWGLPAPGSALAAPDPSRRPLAEGLGHRAAEPAREQRRPGGRQGAGRGAPAGAAPSSGRGAAPVVTARARDGRPVARRDGRSAAAASAGRRGSRRGAAAVAAGAPRRSPGRGPLRRSAPGRAAVAVPCPAAAAVAAWGAALGAGPCALGAWTAAGGATGWRSGGGSGVGGFRSG